MKRKNLFLLCLLLATIPSTILASRPKPKAGHVLVIGIDGRPSYIVCFQIERLFTIFVI